MGTYGRRTVLSVGRSIQVTADGAPVAKAGGVTIDWTKVNVQSSAADLTFENGDIVYAGEKFLRYGQIVVLDSATGKYVPWGSAGTDNVTTAPAKGTSYILNESVHENQPHSDHPPAIDGGRVYKNRLLVTEVVGTSGPGDAVFVVRVDATSGNFHIDVTANGVTQSTAAVAYNVSAANLKTAIIALTTVQDLASGNVDVTLSGSTYTITFHDINASINAVSETLAGNSATVTTTQTTPGVQIPLASGSAATFPALADFEAAFPQISYVPE